MSNLSKQEILKGLEDIKQLECNPEYKTKIINGILDLYNKEVENSISKDKLIEIGNIYKETIKKLNKKDDIERIKTLNTRLEFIQELLLKELGGE